MHLSIDGKIRNLIFAAVLCVTLVSLIMVRGIGVEQDKAYRDNYNRYQLAVKLAGDQKYIEAQEILAGLDDDSQASYQVLYLQAVCLEKNGDFASAADYMQKVRETRPALLQDQNYLCRYGVILYQLGEFKRAELYLQESLKYQDNAGAIQEAQKYLAQIVGKTRVGR